MVDNSDVVLEVLDARDPLGCRCFKVMNEVVHVEIVIERY